MEFTGNTRVNVETESSSSGSIPSQDPKSHKMGEIHLHKERPAEKLPSKEQVAFCAGAQRVNSAGSGNQRNKEPHFTLLPILTSYWIHILAELTCKVEGMFM